jgi:hypothetical protein
MKPIIAATVSSPAAKQQCADRDNLVMSQRAFPDSRACHCRNHVVADTVTPFSDPGLDVTNQRVHRPALGFIVGVTRDLLRLTQ